jgi:hypothetical protein
MSLAIVTSRRKGHLTRVETLPQYSADDQAFRSYFDFKTRIDSPYRLELLRAMSIAKAMVENEQWLDLNTTDKEKWRAFRFHSPSPNARFPRPITNEILPIFDNEVAKSARRKSTAYVRPVAAQEGTTGAAGAMKANEILEWHLETIGWDRKRIEAVRISNLFGTVGLWSSLDQDFRTSIRIGITDARRCKGCSSVLASEQLPQDYLSLASSRGLRTDHSTVMQEPIYPEPGSSQGAGSRDLSYRFEARGCPKCGDKLEQWIPDKTEMKGEDLLGRPLNQETSLNQPDIEVFGPDEMYPENEGIGITDPRNMRKFLRARPVPMEYIYDHYPHLADYVRPDDSRELSDRYFNLGLYGYQNTGTSPDRDLFKDHVMLYTELCDVTKRGGYDHGRLVEFAGGVRLRDEDLYRKSTRTDGVIIPLVKTAFGRYFIRQGHLMGMGLVTPLVSLQSRINMTWAQIVDTRQRHTVNGVMVTEGMRVTAGWVDGYNGRFVKFSPDPQGPDFQPQFIPARTIDGGVYQELDRTQERMQWIAGTQDVDMGKAPRNVRAATAIQMLIDQANGRRYLREAEFLYAFKEIFSHQLLLLAEFAREPRSFRVKNAANKWEYRSFTGLDLEGHTDVVVEEQASYDVRAYEREAILEAITNKLILVTTPYARREVAKAIGVPLKAFDEENTQITDAEAKWYAFRDRKIVPVPDPDLDDHWFMFSTYGRFLKSTDGVRLAIEAGWLEMMPLLSGWEENYSKAVTADKMIRQMLADAKAPANQAAIRMGQPDPAMAARQGLMELIQGGQDPKAMMLPADVKQRVLIIWQRLGADVSQPYVQFRAVVATHKLLFIDKKGAAMLGPVPAAPGGMQTPFGTEPTAGNMPLDNPANSSPMGDASMNAAQG